MAKAEFSSSLLVAAEYGYATEVLTCELIDGSKYRYYAVPSTIWRALKKSNSAGRYAAVNIMRGQYRRRKLA